MKNNLILTDWDGVCVSWIKGFDSFMASKGYTKNENGEKKYRGIHDLYGVSRRKFEMLKDDFHSNGSIAHLPAITGAVEAIHELHSHGYRFHIITSMPDTEAIRELRKQNIINEFGDNDIFTRIEHVEDKTDILSEYRGSGCWWLEDLPENAEIGYNLGLRPILFDRDYNINYSHEGIRRVYSWKEAKELILKET